MMGGVVDFFTRLFGGMAFWVVVLPWQQAIRVRVGRYVRRLEPGIYLKLPVLDTINVESVRRRTSMIPVQTLSTADGTTVTVAGVVGYAISDVEQLYRSLHHAEDTIIQIAQGVIAAEVFRQRRLDLDPAAVCTLLNVQLTQELSRYGLSDVTLYITDFAFVRAIRLINDQRWFHGRVLDTQDGSRSAQ